MKYSSSSRAAKAAPLLKRLPSSLIVFLIVLSISPTSAAKTNLRTPQGVDYNNINNDDASPTATSIVKKFLTWPINHGLITHEDNLGPSSSHAAYPLYSTRSRTLYNRSSNSDNDESSSKTLFSFKLWGSALARQQQRQQQRELNDNVFDIDAALEVATNGGKTTTTTATDDIAPETTEAEPTTTEAAPTFGKVYKCADASLCNDNEPSDDANSSGWTEAGLCGGVISCPDVYDGTTSDYGRGDQVFTAATAKELANNKIDHDDDPYDKSHATTDSTHDTTHDTTHSDAHGATTSHGDGNGHDDAHDAAHEMVVHVTYEDIYAILVFLIIATGAGIFTAKLGMPALVGEIFAGFLFGPPLADFVPFPEALVLVGEIGLIMLLLEAGVELDVAQLRETGTRALAIGVTGTILPLCVGMGLAMASGSAATMKSALAVGASFSPTSLGVAASALKAGKMLDTPVGQLIVASCVVDDVLALILLSLFKVLVQDSPPIIAYFIPIISSLGFLIVLGGSAVTWMPRLIEEKVLKRCSESYRELVMFSIMTVMLLAYLPLLNYTQASYLTGAFLAGCTFSQIEHAHHAFMEKTHQMMTWLLRVFFAASIGFQVPVTQFGDPYVIGWGFILYLCVAAKLPLAFYVPQFEDVKEGATYNPFLRDRLIAALSMTCRGEFSFIIAAFALGEGLFTAQMYAAIVWAVLLSCISSPFMLLNLIKYFNKKQLDYLASTNPIKLAKDAGDLIPLFLHIKVKAPAHGGLQEKFRKIVNELDLEVVERRTNRNGRGLDATVQTDLYVRDTTMTIHLQKIGAQKKIKKALNTAMEGTAAGSTTSFAKQGSIRVSSRNLSGVSLASLEKEMQEAVQKAAQEEDAIIKRGDLVEKRIEEALGDDAKVVVDVWNPWPWTDVLDKIVEHYGLTPGGNSSENMETFVAIFDKIDADGGGEIDQEEMHEALIAAGLDITEEGVMTLVAMIDEDGNGDIDRDEWKDTIEFYLELKEEEAEMQNQQSEHVDFMKRLREKKLEQLGKRGGAPAAVAIVEEGVEDEESIGMDVDA